MTRRRTRSTNRMIQRILVGCVAFQEHSRLHRSFRSKWSNKAPRSQGRIVIVPEVVRVGMEELT